MKAAIILFLFILSSCSNSKDRYLPGEKYKLDTMLYSAYRKIDKETEIQCVQLKQKKYFQAIDSILKLRQKDINDIKLQSNVK